MTVHIDISNRQKMGYLVELLKSLDFVERVRVDEAEPQPTTDPQPATQPSFFERHYGSMPNLDVAAFEAYLDETRQGWDEREAAHDRIRANPADNPYQP
jgi:hypothetical protein